MDTSEINIWTSHLHLQPSFLHLDTLCISIVLSKLFFSISSKISDHCKPYHDISLELNHSSRMNNFEAGRTDDFDISADKDLLWAIDAISLKEMEPLAPGLDDDERFVDPVAWTS